VRKGDLISCTVTREYRDDMGSPNATNTMQAPSNNAIGPRIAMPPGMLADNGSLLLTGTNQPPPTIDVALCHFKINFHELLAAANPPPGYVASKNPKKAPNVTGVLATNYTIEETLSVYFLQAGNSSVEIDPVGLSDTINITITLQAGYTPPATNKTTVTCGAWNDSFSGWSDGGCTVIETNFTAGYIICACTHASDFTAWNTFVADLQDTTIGPVVATIAIITLAILIPSIAVIWLLLLYYAKHADERDAENIQLGAILLLTKNKIRQRIQIKRFFRLLRQNAQNPQPVSKMDYEKLRLMTRLKEEERVCFFLAISSST